MLLTLTRHSRLLGACLLALLALTLGACGRPDDLPTGAAPTATALAGATATASPLAETATATTTPAAVTATASPLAETATATAQPTQVGEIDETDPFTGTTVLTDTDDLTDTVGLAPNRVATAIAGFFAVPVGQVVAQHQQGQGYGEIARAYFLAQELAADGNPANDLSAEQILALHQAGQGWGQIVRSLGLPQGNQHRNLGQIMSGRGQPASPTAQPAQGASSAPAPANRAKEHGQDAGGNGNDGGNGKGNGGGKGNGNGNGNGNGKGNGGKTK